MDLDFLQSNTHEEINLFKEQQINNIDKSILTYNSERHRRIIIFSTKLLQCYKLNYSFELLKKTFIDILNEKLKILNISYKIKSLSINHIKTIILLSYNNFLIIFNANALKYINIIKDYIIPVYDDVIIDNR